MMYFSFFCLGVIVYSILLYSIFEIYYASPIVKGAISHPISSTDFAPADRLVIFSADGLRSSSFYEHPDRSSFIHHVIRNGQGSWGISQSHVPTESRPGHVAMMAGFYEDVSAVTHGWKHNPVPFDNTLNQSAMAFIIFIFMWGSPDIVHLFSTNIPHSFVETYSPEEEDFFGDNPEKLDEWVFKRVETYLQSGKTEAKIRQKLSTKRSIFFLHLLGLDTNGHGSKPRSEKYLQNIALVDAGVQRVVRLFDQYFGDNRTAYIFTADHGMTDWGSHGDGTDHEILTPLVAWGAGIRKSTHRQTLNQVDLAPFQSALLGIAIPVNSFGTLPLQLLDATPKYQFQAAFANFLQMVEQYKIRRQERRAHSLPFLFTDFPGFQAQALKRVHAVSQEISRLSTYQRYEAAANACMEWIPRVRDGFSYFHHYHRFSLGLAIATLFLSWNLALYVFLTRDYTSFLKRSVFLPNRSFAGIILISSFLIWIQGLPLTNYLYFLTPLYLQSIIFKMASFGDRSFLLFGIASRWANALKSALFFAVFAGVALALFVSVFFDRAVLSILFVCLSPFWFLIKPKYCKWRFLWFLSCNLLAIFPQLDTVGNSPNFASVITSPLLNAALLKAYTIWRRHESPRILRYLYYLHLVEALLMLLPKLNSLSGFELAIFLLPLRLFAWACVPISFALPLLSAPSKTSDRLIVWFSALNLLFGTFTVAYEGIFLLVFGTFLFAYIRLENAHLSDAEFLNADFHLVRTEVDPRKPEGLGTFSASEWARAALLVAGIEIAFFGTGNIASLSSFNPLFLRNFIGVFSPFTMAALLILKIAIPFCELALVFAAVMHSTGQRLPRLSALMMLVTNAMALVFFFNLKTDGSWLQIGISISNYVISLLSSVIAFLLIHIADYFLLLPSNNYSSTGGLLSLPKFE